MKTIQQTVTVYSFNELDESTQAQVLGNMRDINTDYAWWNYTYETMTTVGKMLGINIDNIYFSGFYSQGDGALFTGSYSYNKGWRKALSSEFGGEWLKVLIAIGETLQAIQAPMFYKLSASVTQSGHYNHSGCTAFNVYYDGDYLTSEKQEQAETDLIQALREFMDFIYCQLEKEYDYLVSDEAVIESIESNDYEFLENGSIY